MDNEKKFSDEEVSPLEKIEEAETLADDDPSVEWAKFAAQACALRSKLNEKKKD